MLTPPGGHWLWWGMWTALAGWFLGPVNQRIHTVTSVSFVFNPNTLYFKIVGYQFYFSPLEFEIMGFDNIGTITSKSLTFHGCWIVLKPPFTCIYKIFDSVRIMCFNSLWSNLPGILIINKLSYMLTICMHSVWS